MGKLIRKLKRLLGFTEEMEELLLGSTIRRIRALKNEIKGIEGMKADLDKLKASDAFKKKWRKKFDEMIAKKLLVSRF